MKILLATNNDAKIERLKKLFKYIDSSIELYSPKELNLEIIEVLENANSLIGNAELKAKAYFGKVDMPILTNDTGLYVEGEGLIDAPKRQALGKINPNTLSKKEISEKMLNFWQEIATKYGGKVDAAWIDTFVMLYPDGKIKKSDSRREIILTNKILGKAHLETPIRTLYYSKSTNKPASLHTEDENKLEMEPIIDALRKIL